MRDYEREIRRILTPRYRKRCVWCGQPCHGRTCAQHKETERDWKRREKGE